MMPPIQVTYDDNIFTYSEDLVFQLRKIFKEVKARNQRDLSETEKA